VVLGRKVGFDCERLVIVQSIGSGAGPWLGCWLFGPRVLCRSVEVDCASNCGELSLGIGPNYNAISSVNYWNVFCHVTVRRAF